MTVYVLIYDVDHGSREDCNIFYSPIEVFSDAKTRQARIQKLTDLNEDIGWREEDLELHDNADFEISEHYQPYADEDEEDDDEEDDDDSDVGNTPTVNIWRYVPPTDPSGYCFYACQAPDMFGDEDDELVTTVSITPIDYFEQTGNMYDQHSEVELPDGFDEVMEGQFVYDGTVDEAKAALLSLGMVENPAFCKMIQDYMDKCNEDNDEFAEGSYALTLLEELTDEVNQEEENTGIEFSDDFMNLSLGEFLDALADKFDADEKEKESLLVKEPELKPEDCYYCAMTIDNPWDGEEDASMVLVIPKDKFDGIKEPTPVDIPYGLVPVVMTESHSGVYLYRGVPDDAKEIMNRYGFVESSDFQKFCEDME
jgi:hypothetical protein